MVENRGLPLMSRRVPPGGRAAPLLYALLLPAVFVSAACAQNVAPRSAHAPTEMQVRDLAGLTPLQLHRLAGIVDMKRSGEPVWVAMNRHDGFAPCLSEAFASPDSSAVMAWASGREDGAYDVFGPFQSREGPEWETEVVRVEVTFLDIAADTTYQETVDLENVDAIFLTPSATERFLLPYVLETYGMEVALEWYDEWRLKRRGVGGHWNSCPTVGIRRPTWHH